MADRIMTFEQAMERVHELEEKLKDIAYVHKGQHMCSIDGEGPQGATRYCPPDDPCLTWVLAKF